jgi:hypothetical protein
MADDNILSGACGIAYALLKCETDTLTDSYIAPAMAEWFGRPKAKATRGPSYIALYNNRLPRHSASAAFLHLADQATPLSLDGIRRLAARQTDIERPAAESFALEHELELAALGANQAGNHILFRREKARLDETKALFRTSNQAVVMRAALIFDSVRAELKTLPFDPESPPAETAAPKPTFVLRSSRSHGVLEQKISPLIYHLLREFREAKTVSEAIERVSGRVKVDKDKVGQVTALCCQYVRQFASLGILEIVGSATKTSRHEHRNRARIVSDRS